MNSLSRWVIALFGLTAIGLALNMGLRRLDRGLVTQPTRGWLTEAALDFSTERTGRRKSIPTGPIENLVLIVGDGMGFGQTAIARNELVGPNGRLQFERAPVVGWTSTHTVDKLFTDSAATATALATGHKSYKGAIGVDAGGVSRVSLAELLAASGKAVGLVTDSYLWDATPGAFAAHVETRREYDAIAEQMSLSGFDLLVGNQRSDRNDRGLFFTQQGWSMSSDFPAWRESLRSGAQAVGFFSELANPEVGTTLREVTEVAVKELQERSASGFFLLVETEETDTASHRNDLPRMIQGVASLDSVVEFVFDFAAKNSRTLVGGHGRPRYGGTSDPRRRRRGAPEGSLDARLPHGIAGAALCLRPGG